MELRAQLKKSDVRYCKLKDNFSSEYLNMQKQLKKKISALETELNERQKKPQTENDKNSSIFEELNKVLNEKLNKKSDRNLNKTSSKTDLEEEYDEWVIYDLEEEDDNWIKLDMM